MSAPDQISVTIEIPDKEPFEGKATQKQKQRIWELGYQDEAVISGLGKKQASMIISQLYAVHQREQGRRSTRKMLIASTCILLAAGAAILLGQSSEAIKHSDTMAVVALIGFFVGAPMFIFAILRWSFSAISRRFE